MARNLLQDMVKVKNPTIESRIVKKGEIPNKIKSNSSKNSKYRLYFVALLSIIFLLFALSFLFSGAKVTITPKVKEVSLNQNLSAIKDGNSDELPFDLVVISGEENKTIPGGEETDVAFKAMGTVVIYNAFGFSPQSLDIDTRLEGSNGKIYKTIRKVTIPGVASDTKPGSVEVDIYASQAGEEYNSPPLDFKILGFKGTPKYSKIYARSKGALTGGFKGKTPMVSALDKTAAVSELKVMLEAKLLKKATDQIPSGFILFKDAVFLNINDKDVDFSATKDNMVGVNVKGTLYGFLFDEKKLTKKIAESIVEKYDGSEVYIPNIRDLTFSLVDKENISFADVKNINFSLVGVPKIIWKIDEAKFITDILNKKKTEFNKILSQYPSIDSAILVIRPFWKTSFPEKSESIQLIVNYPE